METFDAVLAIVRPFGRYQKLLLFIFGCYTCFNCATPYYIFIVLSYYIPSTRCIVPPGMDNRTAELFVPETHPDNSSVCSMVDFSSTNWTWVDGANLSALGTTDCAFGREFEHYKWTRSIYSDFDLVCEKSHETSMLLTLCFAGSAVGSFIWAPLLDNIGRKPLLLVACIWIAICGIILPFIRSLLGMKIMSFLVGIPGHIEFPLIAMYCSEFTDIGRQAVVFLSLVLAFCVGTYVLSLVLYLATDWRTVSILMAVIHILVIIPTFFADESPRWLLSVGKRAKAEKIIDRIKTWNSVELSPADEERLEKTIAKLDTSKNPDHSDKRMFWHLFMNGWSIALKSIILSYLQITCMMIYVGVVIIAESFRVDPILVFVVTNNVEVIASPLLVLANHLGRVPLGALCFVLCGVFSLLTAFCTNLGYLWLTVGLVFMTRFTIALAWDCISLSCSEGFPTILRGTGSGFPKTISITASIFLPTLILKAENLEGGPMMVFGVMSLVAGVLYLLLPETGSLPFIDTIEEEKELVSMKWSTPLQNLKSLAGCGSLIRERKLEQRLNHGPKPSDEKVLVSSTTV